MSQQTETIKTKDKPITVGFLQFMMYIITMAVAAMIFFGAFDKRITVLETEMQHKVNDKQLFERLEQMEIKITNKIETEISKIKNENKSER